LGLALLMLAVGTAQARPVRPPQAAVRQPGIPHLVIVEGDGGFIIRCETRANPQSVGIPRGAIPPLAIPLGASVRIDRAALQNPNHKDISHGETR
jgi:hypothetical protein